MNGRGTTEVFENGTTFQKLKSVGEKVARSGFRPRLGANYQRKPTRYTGCARESAPVFFVVGFPKSGTTWLMRTLDRPPEILCQGEGRFFGRNWRRDDLKDIDGNKQASSL